MLVVAFVSFSLFNFVGDPINNMVGEETSDEERAELRERLKNAETPSERIEILKEQSSKDRKALSLSQKTLLGINNIGKSLKEGFMGKVGGAVGGVFGLLKKAALIGFLIMLPKIKHKSNSRKIFFRELPKINSLTNHKNTQTDNNRRLDCCICLQEFTPCCEQPNVSITKCHHFFCTSCLIKTMKYGNKCPLCRTILRSPTERLTMTPTLSNTIVQQELLFYDDYIKESFNYIIDMIHIIYIIYGLG